MGGLKTVTEKMYIAEREQRNHKGLKSAERSGGSGGGVVFKSMVFSYERGEDLVPYFSTGYRIMLFTAQSAWGGS